jgi:hypothetical protein
MTVERMIELLEIEKECVRRNACGECNRACHICDLLQDDTELHEMYEEVIALLKAQEPRVIDFDDVIGGDECWLEAINGACGYADCYACTGTGEVQVFRCNFDNPQYIKASDYLKTWRCWTSRPTDEQRKDVAWG